MSEQQKQEKRREWVVGRRGSYTTGWPIYEDGALVTWLASTPREATARQIVDDHNSIGGLEAELERTRAALAALVDATNRVYMAFLIGYTATEGNGLLDLYEAKDQANAVLPATQSSKTEAGQ